MLRKDQLIIFKRRTETGHVFAVERHGQHHLFHLVAVSFCRLFCQILTITPRIHFDTVTTGQTIAKPEQHLLLLFKRHIGKLNQKRHLAGGVVVHRHRGQHGQVTRTRKVFPQTVAQILREFFQLRAHHRFQPFPDLCPALAFRQCVKFRCAGKAQHFSGATGRTFTQ
ncbi:Uncharacterised protein [Shigella sonnei]|nr:Uncharacterised protein [Shigella sonnei]SJB63893.1 Uncharacterised protein [Shigella sonnei]